MGDARTAQRHDCISARLCPRQRHKEGCPAVLEPPGKRLMLGAQAPDPFLPTAPVCLAWPISQRSKPPAPVRPRREQQKC
jgi:hypothetical protein